MWSTKQLKNILGYRFKKDGKVEFDPTQECYSLEREELCYHKMAYELAFSTLIPADVSREVIRVLQTEGLPFAQKQDFIQLACDAWLNRFNVDSTLPVIEAVYQLRSLMSKIPFEGSDRETSLAAITTLLDGEKQCEETNEKFERCFSTPGKWIDVSHLPEEERNLIYRVRAEIFRILGEFGPLELEKVLKLCTDFGPGQNNDQDLDSSHTAEERSRRKAQCSLLHKMTNSLSITSAAQWLVRPLLRGNHTWLKSLLSKHLGPNHRFWWDSFACSLNVHRKPEAVISMICHDFVSVNDVDHVALVPKNAKTKRTIAKANNLNSMLTKAAGSLMKHKLFKNGINLYDQSINQSLALLGSRSNQIATLDCKNASGTVAYNLVKLLLPVEWFTFLACLRSPKGRINFPKLGFDNYELTYEQFSSMGCGFTFELESTIFAAITRATVAVGSQQNHFVSIYGDDIICPTKDALEVIKNLEYFGFTINKEKSFIDGPFRESCGVDAYNGVNIRPVVLKRRLCTVVDHWFFMNRIAYQCLDRRSRLLAGCYDSLFKSLDKKWIIPGPVTYAVKQDEHREGSFELDADDLESGLKLPMSKALDYHTLVRFTENGAIKYYRLKLTQLNDRKWKTEHFPAKDNPRIAFDGYFTAGSPLPIGHSSTIEIMAGICGFIKGQLPLRGHSTREFKQTTSVVWESYTIDIMRRYFPLDR